MEVSGQLHASVALPPVPKLKYGSNFFDKQCYVCSEVSRSNTDVGQVGAWWNVAKSSAAPRCKAS